MYTRQIYVTPESNEKVLDDFKKISFEAMDIFYHHLNEVYSFQSANFNCLIVGSIVHPEHSAFDIDKLLLKQEINCFEDLNRALSRCIGRYYQFYKGQDGLYLRADATSLAQINYSQQDKTIATDLNLLKEVSNDFGLNKAANDFYVHTFPKKGNGNAWVGNESIYKDVNKILPNHSLDLQHFTESRYWPWDSFKENNFNSTVHKIADELKGVLCALSEVAPLSIAVTGGYDSRVMLAASKNIKHKCYYFIDKLSFMTDTHSDTVIGSELCKRMDVEFHIHKDFPAIKDIPESFKSDFMNNVFFATQKRIPEVYYYHQHLSKHTNICGVGEFGRSVYGAPSSSKSVSFLCQKYQCSNSEYAITETEKWLRSVKNSKELAGYPINTLYYIEQKIGNWGAVGNAESDIAFEEVNPFASHYLISLMLMLKPKYTAYANSKLFSALIHELAPELDGVPINPASGFKEKTIKLIKGNKYYPYIDEFRAFLTDKFSKRGF